MESQATGAPFITVEQVSIAPTAQVKAAGLSTPEAGDSSDVHALNFCGWVLGKYRKVTHVDIMWRGRQLRRVTTTACPGRLARWRNTAANFSTSVGTLGLPPDFELQLHAILGTRLDSAPFAIVRGQRRPLSPTRHHEIQPLLLTGLGRSGTTWVMRLLEQQPEVVLFRRYPYESRMSVYAMQMLKVLSEPPNVQTSPGRDAMTVETLQTIGPNPYFGLPETGVEELRLFCGRTYPQELADFCCQSIQQWYERLAASQNQAGAKYFAEKAVPNHVSWLMWELYPAMREIILVRDFRDLIASALAFNAKRGFVAFSRNRVKSDAEYVELIGRRAADVLHAWKSRSPQACLLRYEDLIQHPHAELKRLLEYLQLDCSDERVQSTLKQAGEDTPELQYHRTSASVESSMGRWKRDLPPHLQRLCEQKIGPVLHEFGYEV
jgi:hypothetical protein